MYMATLHITQHKRFVPYGTHPNPALLRLGVEISRSSVKTSQELFNRVVENDNKCWASFMLGTLYEMGIFENFRFFRYQFKIDRGILPRPLSADRQAKFAQKERRRGKEFCFSSCFAQKREDSASLPDKSIYFFRLRASRIGRIKFLLMSSPH